MPLPYDFNALVTLIARLAQRRRSVTMAELTSMDPGTEERLLVVRCDVERDVPHALRFGRAVAAVGGKVSFYFHTRRDTYRPDLFPAFKELGHEVAYHHECLDRTRGDFEAARTLFRQEAAMFGRDGFPLATVCAHGESGLRKDGYRFTYELFDRYPGLLEETGVQAEVYRQINPVWKPVYPSDVFSSYRRFFATAEAGIEAPGLMELLIHPHRWRTNPLVSGLEVAHDLAQAAQNKVFHYRRYDAAA